MKRTGGNKTRAAQLLGMGRDALYAKLEKYGIDRTGGGDGGGSRMTPKRVVLPGAVARSEDGFFLT